MKTSLLNKGARTVVLAGMVGFVLLLTDRFTGNMQPKPEGWILVALTTAFFISEMFFWNAIEALSELPKAAGITAAETQSLSTRIQNLKKELIKRWFTLLILKAVAGTSAAFLTNQDAPGGHQRLLWLAGVGSIALSLPIALSFFRNWEHADAMKSKQIIEAKQQIEEKTSAEALAKPPAKPLNADKLLTHYTTVIRAPKSKSSKR